MSSTSFSIKDDLKIAYWAEPDGGFMLGFSILGGTDVLANSNKSWVSLTNYVNSVELENGTQVDQGILNYPKAGTCSISMQGDGLSSFVNRSLRAGAFVSVGLVPTDTVGALPRTNSVLNPKPAAFTGDNTLWYGADRVGSGALVGGYWVDTMSIGNTTYSYWIGSDTDAFNQSSEVYGNKQYTASVYLTSSIQDYRAVFINWYDNLGAFISQTTTGVRQSFPANTETRISITATSPAAAQFATFGINGGTSGTAAAFRPAGATMKGRKALLEQTGTVKDWFDGDTDLGFRKFVKWVGITTDGRNRGISIQADQQPTLFVGRIKTVDTSYPLEGPAQVTINATDFMEDFTSYSVANYDLPVSIGHAAPFNTYETITPAFDEYYKNATLDYIFDYELSQSYVAPTANLQDFSDPVVFGGDAVSVSTIVNSALDAELGMMFVDYQNYFDGLTVTSTTYLASRNAVYGDNADNGLYRWRRPFYSAGNTGSPDAVINDIQLYSTTNELANKVVATLAWDTATKVVDKNQDAIDLYGELSTERSLNLWNAFALNLWAKALNEYSPVKYVRSVAGITATPNSAIGAFAYMKPGDLLTVQFSHNDLVLNEAYRIVNVNHSISVDEWNTTVELWKGN